MSNASYYQRNKDVILKRAKHYYENENARDKYRDLSEEIWKKEIP